MILAVFATFLANLRKTKNNLKKTQGNNLHYNVGRVADIAVDDDRPPFGEEDLQLTQTHVLHRRAKGFLKNIALRMFLHFFKFV